MACLQGGGRERHTLAMVRMAVRAHARDCDDAPSRCDVTFMESHCRPPLWSAKSRAELEDTTRRPRVAVAADCREGRHELRDKPDAEEMGVTAWASIRLFRSRETEVQGAAVAWGKGGGSHCSPPTEDLGLCVASDADGEAAKDPV